MSRPPIPAPRKRLTAAMLSIGIGLLGWALYGAAFITHLIVPYIARLVLAENFGAYGGLYGMLYSLPSLVAVLGMVANVAGLVFGIASFSRPDCPRRQSYAGLAINGLPCCLGVLAGIGFVLLIAALSGGRGLVAG